MMNRNILTLIQKYSDLNPDLTFGQIVQLVCGLARPADVTEEFFMKWLSQSICQETNPFPGK